MSDDLKLTSLEPKESDIKVEIRDYLKKKGIFHWHVLATLGCFPGLPDRMASIRGANGITYTLHIEVKTKKNVQSEAQIKFEQNIKATGGIYILARCLKDVSDVVEAILDGTYKPN